MGNKKSIVIAAVLAMLSTGFNSAMANNSNSLLQMDVKKSSSTDTVDVTFYTTAPTSNSVVTRKANNRYVVLLPNTDSSSSITPGLGGVKDLISDIEVKHVNDGIGGYTKVTFSTTKPINIKTYMKKTNPLTQAQKDYKDIIAKNDVASAAPTPQEKSQPATTSTNTAKQAAAPQKTPPATQKPASNHFQLVSVNKETANKAQTKQVNSTPAVPFGNLNFNNKITSEIKIAQNTAKLATQQAQTKKSTESKAQPVSSAITAKTTPTPKAQDIKNITETKSVEPTPIIEKEQTPIVQTNKTEQQATVASNGVVSQLKNIKHKTTSYIEGTEKKIKNKISNNTSKPIKIPMWLLYAGGSVLSLGLLYCVIGALSKIANKNKAKWQDLFAVTDAKPQQKKTSNYEDIVNNIELNWQEKYKRYSEKEEEFKNDNTVSDLSYVTDLSGVKKAIIPAFNAKTTQDKQEIVSEINKKKIPESISIKQLKSDKNREEFKKQMRAKISNLEHSLAQIPTLEGIVDNSNKFKSEDESIINKLSEVKLKSFSKPISLKETHRSLLEDDKTISRNKSYKEGRFVKLKNSALSVTRRKSAASDLNVSDLINTGSKYLMNNGEMKMNKEKENYLLSSLDEYLSILDGEKSSTTTLSRTSVADSLSQVKSSSIAMSRSGVTNPINRSSNPISGKTSTPYMNGLVVKSGYNIDAQRGIYLVNIDGVSALVGRIDSNIFILKKFDSVIDKPLQVRQDDANVYIVKAGRYKCLVDVSKDKMGTLIEI